MDLLTSRTFKRNKGKLPPGMAENKKRLLEVWNYAG